jgi:hypothetical protein
MDAGVSATLSVDPTAPVFARALRRKLVLLFTPRSSMSSRDDYPDAIKAPTPPPRQRGDQPDERRSKRAARPGARRANDRPAQSAGDVRTPGRLAAGTLEVEGRNAVGKGQGVGQCGVG